MPRFPNIQPEVLRSGSRVPSATATKTPRRRTTHVPLPEPVLDAASWVLIVVLLAVGAFLLGALQAGWF